MRSLFLFLIFLLAAAWISFARYYYVCTIKQLCEEQTAQQRDSTLEVTYQDSVLLSGYEEFAFGNKEINPDLTPNNTALLDSLAALLIANPDWRLTIEGYYRRTESNMSAGFHENLGQARANLIRNLLLERGVQDSISLNFNVTDDELLKQPVKFSVFDSKNTPDEYVKVLFTFYNMTFSDANFAYDDDEFRPGQALVSYADSVKNFLADRPDKIFTIIGHTDAHGSPAYNMDLGMRRAQSAKDYFIDLGISNTINIDSKGESEPMAPNDNEENRQKNRRVNFKID